MSPADSNYLLRSLELLSASIDRSRGAAEGSLQEIEVSGVLNVVEAFAQSAIRAGMHSDRAYGYAEEYTASVSRAKNKIGAAIALLADAHSAIDTAAHIARVVPHRCPSAPGIGGSKVLAFT